MIQILSVCVLLAQENAAAAKVDFEREVRPVFEKSCYGCHSAKAQMGALRLDTKAGAARTIAPGKPGESTLYTRIMGRGDLPRMPMGGKPLEAAQIATIKTWIAQGADWPAGSNAPLVSEGPKHWGFVPPKKAPLPAVAGTTPIDKFINAKLASEGFKMSPEANRVTLLRRLSLDLIGLPPTPAE
ncbi:MAG: DUF1549 domain-containing protein, partial [Acidobacteria bacterium]|nr:DUF1549 domain-containing protein [Acidobacteriota bacterium]